MINYDNINDWRPKLTNVLGQLVPESAKQEIADAKLKCCEDVLNLFFELTDKEAIIDKMLDWLQSTKIVCFHSTRLTDIEVESIRKNGLILLDANNRYNRLVDVLSPHPEWSNKKHLLKKIIKKYGQENCEGRRDGVVCFALSEDRKNHYLIYGSEFDRCVVRDIFPKKEEGLNLLYKYGKPRIISIKIPGDLVLETTDVELVQATGDVPNIVKEFLYTWCYKLANLSSKKIKDNFDNCSLTFQKPFLSNCIIDIKTLNDDKIPQPSQNNEDVEIKLRMSSFLCK